MRPIAYGKQHITDQDIQAVIDTLKSDFLTQGPKISEFEDAFASYVGSKYAVAVANGTAALHLCALALEIKPGQKVITTPITFAASANCVRYCGGTVEFVDINPQTFLIDIEKVKELICREPAGTFSGIISVDFAGKPVELEALKEIATSHGLWIIEDACHAPGGSFVDKNGVTQKCGNGAFADLAIFSFHPVKHIATGEGGMITTNDQGLFEKLMELRTHGITRNQQQFVNDVNFACGGEVIEPGKYPGWYMEMQTLGYNYRITDFQAALGLSQLSRANEGLMRRKYLAKNYDEAFNEHPFVKSQLNELTPNSSSHAYHLYVILAQKRHALYSFLKSHQIFCQIHYIPVHLMPYYRELGWRPGDMPEAERYYTECLSLPMYPTLTEEEQKFVINKINEFYLHS